MKQRIGITQEEKDAVLVKLEEKKLGSEEFEAAFKKEINRIKEVKRNTLARHTDQRVVNIMRNLKHQLKHNADALKTDGRLKKSLHDIKKIIIVHGSLNTTTAVTSLALLGAIGASMATPAAPLAAPICAGVRSIVSLGKHVIVKFALDRMLDNREFAASFKKDGGAAAA